MIRTKLVEEKLRHQRLDAKSLDNLFRRRIEQGANCSPFVSGAILQTVKDVFPLSAEDTNNTLGLGQIKLLVVAATEPAVTVVAVVGRVLAAPLVNGQTAPSRPNSGCGRMRYPRTH